MRGVRASRRTNGVTYGIHETNPCNLSLLGSSFLVDIQPLNGTFHYSRMEGGWKVGMRDGERRKLVLVLGRFQAKSKCDFFPLRARKCGKLFLHRLQLRQSQTFILSHFQQEFPNAETQLANFGADGTWVQGTCLIDLIQFPFRGRRHWCWEQCDVQRHRRRHFLCES
jgi:hypothetical protein